MRYFRFQEVFFEKMKNIAKRNILVLKVYGVDSLLQIKKLFRYGCLYQYGSPAFFIA